MKSAPHPRDTFVSADAGQQAECLLILCRVHPVGDQGNEAVDYC